jgi:hypothetical protein
LAKAKVKAEPLQHLNVPPVDAGGSTSGAQNDEGDDGSNSSDVEAEAVTPTNNGQNLMVRVPHGGSSHPTLLTFFSSLPAPSTVYSKRSSPKWGKPLSQYNKPLLQHFKLNLQLSRHLKTSGRGPVSKTTPKIGRNC